MRDSTLFACAVLALGFTGCARPDSDKDFVEKAAIGGMMEVELGRHATQFASSPEVRSFGERMVADHSRANAELTEIAKQQGLPVPTAIDEKHRREVSELTEKQGSDFDEAYLKTMISDHKDVIDEFKAQARAGKTQVDQFAAKTLPTIESHLAQAKSLKDGLDKHASL